MASEAVKTKPVYFDWVHIRLAVPKILLEHQHKDKKKNLEGNSNKIEK